MFACLLLIGYLVPGIYVIGVALALGDAPNMVNINSLPMVIDTRPRMRISALTPASTISLRSYRDYRADSERLRH